MPSIQKIERLDLIDFNSDQFAEAIRRLGNRWINKTGALFLGFGRRKREGRLLDEWCIKFYVARKLKRPDKEKLIPDSVNLTIILNGKKKRMRFPTDVVAVRFAGDRITQSGNIAFIYNENSPNVKGTVTALVEEPNTARRFLLSAGHVAARNRTVTPAVIGEKILNENGILIGPLAHATDMSMTPLDAALIELSFDDVASLLRRVNDKPITEVCSVDDVIKGNKDNYTMLSWVDERPMTFHACVHDVKFTYKVGAVTFPTLLHFEGEASGGDSGSLVIDGNNKAVGMHILGLEGTDSFCHPIQTVLNQCIPGNPLVLVY